MEGNFAKNMTENECHFIEASEYLNEVIEKTAKEITKKLYEFIEKNNIQENILKKAEELEEKEQKEAADGYRAGIKIFFDVLDEIFMIFENDKMSFERYNKILQIGISQSEFGRIPSSFDQVLFGDTDRTKTRDIKIRLPKFLCKFINYSSSILES